MTALKARGPRIVRTAVALLATAYAATFVVAVLLHLGVEIPLGFVVKRNRSPGTAAAPNVGSNGFPS
jgi:hypothetical protein